MKQGGGVELVFRGVLVQWVKREGVFVKLVMGGVVAQ